MARQLDAYEQAHPQRPPVQAAAERPIALAVTEPPVDEAGEPDDSDMVVIEEDLVDHPSDIHKKSIFTVRPGDYRSLFARLRRGDREDRLQPVVYRGRPCPPTSIPATIGRRAACSCRRPPITSGKTSPH